VGNAWKIVISKPHYEPDITRRLAAVSSVTYYNKGDPSPECNNVICGHVIDSFDRYFTISGQKQEILAFVRAQLGNSRLPVALKAAAFLKKHPPADR